MGCDGGTIPKRDELVRKKKKPEKKDKQSELAFRWQYCIISQLLLRQPIVSCGLGRLYSKESVLEGLLDRSILPESAQHLKSLKDVKTLNLTPNPSYEGDKAVNGGYTGDNKSPFICPVVGLEMNGKHNFCFLWTCGCVLSERAIKSIKSTNCHKCQKPFTEADIVVLNSEGDVLKTMENNMVQRKLAEKMNKKRKAATDANCEETTVKDSTKKVKKEKSDFASASSSKSIANKTNADKEKVKEYSIAEDPKASNVLKSIFTTHQTAADQTKAHWITYNPFYN